MLVFHIFLICLPEGISILGFMIVIIVGFMVYGGFTRLKLNQLFFSGAQHLVPIKGHSFA